MRGLRISVNFRDRVLGVCVHILFSLKSHLLGFRFILVGFLVFSEMIASHETLSTFGTRESFLSRVGSKMSLKLVGARKTLPAEQPVTDERPLSGVPAKVSLQMRRFTVDFPAAWDVTDVLLAFVWTARVRGHLTVGAPTSSASSGPGDLGRCERDDARRGNRRDARGDRGSCTRPTRDGVRHVWNSNSLRGLHTPPR